MLTFKSSKFHTVQLSSISILEAAASLFCNLHPSDSSINNNLLSSNFRFGMAAYE